MPGVNFLLFYYHEWPSSKLTGADVNYRDFMESCNTIENRKLTYQGYVRISKCLHTYAM